VFSHFNSILGDFEEHAHALNFNALALPVLPSVTIDHCFSEEEVWAVIREMPADKALGPDGFFRHVLSICMAGNQGRHHECPPCLLITRFSEFLLGSPVLHHLASE
jgi:hypothetical protein